MKKKKQETALPEEALWKANGAPATEESGEEDPKSEKNSEGEMDRQAGFQKMEEDIALFHSLFPEVKGEEIPQEVWERVEKGESLAAAFALFTIQKMREEEKIRAVNEENEKKAPPRIRHDGAEAEYFSPEAVRSMSRSEIKKNYDAILRSMEKWN